jgi:hypothetical protein
VIAIAAALAVLSLSASGSLGIASETRDERVRLIDRSPVTVAGTSFRPSERITLAVTLGEERIVRVLRATPTGTFRSVFPKLTYDRCLGALAVSAQGARGSCASWTVQPLECPARSGDT